mmetsp:Transcript_59291/g.122665  ORF Transcript_59291/g.122665 Transcript_59291/m.122665 type:complete len:95 (-) Transcript_59291:122-406(-)
MDLAPYPLALYRWDNRPVWFFAIVACEAQHHGRTAVVSVPDRDDICHRHRSLLRAARHLSQRPSGRDVANWCEARTLAAGEWEMNLAAFIRCSS